MKPIQYYARILTIVMAVGSFGCGKMPEYSTTSGGFSGSSGDWSLSGGIGHLESGKPGVLFGSRRAPAGVREFSYVFIYRHPVRLLEAGVRSKAESRTDDQIEKVRENLVIGQGELDIALDLNKDRESKTFKVASFKINGQEVDLGKGKVFLVDFTTKPVAVKQIDVSLPIELPKVGEPYEVKPLCERIVKEVTGVNEEARKFLQL